MKTISFTPGDWEGELIPAWTWRYDSATPVRQGENCIYIAENPNHPEGFDNASLLTPKRFGVGAKATLRCAFEGIGCPEIILVPKTEENERGEKKYGACFEVVLWKNGINVWRHYREDGKCFWHKRLGLTYPVAEGEIHTLTVEVLEKELSITLNGQNTTLRTEDIPEAFHLGLTMCEGVARVYDFTAKGESLA